MPRRDQLDELDQKIAATFQSAAEELRQEVVERLQDTRDRLHRLVHEAARAEGEEAGQRPASSDLPALLEATSALVTASTQEEILHRLLEGVSRFCRRAALFLVDDRIARLWAARPSDDFGESTVSIDGNRCWERLLLAQGAMRLTADDCRRTLDVGTVEPEGSAPTGGALIPMSLADRLVAALYVDGLDGDSRNGARAPLEPFQLLVQSASACLESLSLRPRRLPVALRMAREDDAAGRLDLWTLAEDPGGKDPGEEE
jgi:hypothetical protein